MLEFIAVGEVVSIEGSYSSLYILVIYMCVTEPSRNRRQESSGTFGSNIPSFENKDVDVDVNVQLLRSEISVLWTISCLEEKSLMGAD